MLTDVPDKCGADCKEQGEYVKNLFDNSFIVWYRGRKGSLESADMALHQRQRRSQRVVDSFVNLGNEIRDMMGTTRVDVRTEWRATIELTIMNLQRNIQHVNASEPNYSNIPSRISRCNIRT